MLRQAMIRVSAILLFFGLLPLHANDQSDQKTNEGIRLFSEAYRTWNGDGFAKAATTFSEAGECDPNAANARYWLGVSQFHRMLYLQHHARAKAMEAQAATEREAAIRTFEQLLASSPNHAEAHALLGTLLGMKIQGGMFRAMRYGPALQRHQQAALQSGPQNPRVRYLSGVGLFHVANDAGGYRKALTELQKADMLFTKEAKSAPKSLEPRWGHSSCITFMGLTLEKLGRKPEAVAEFHRALELHPADHKAKTALQRLGANH